MKKTLLRVFGFLGVIIFLPPLILSFTETQLIENSSQSFIKWRLEEKTRQKIDAVKLPDTSSLENFLGIQATKLRQDAEQELALVKQQLKDDAPAIIANQMARMRDLDCKCRLEWQAHIQESMHLKAGSLDATREKLVNFTQQHYMKVVKELTLDVRIFLAINSFIFIALFAVSFLKPAAVNHLFLPGSLMLLSTLVCSYFYLFHQNWLYTIIFNDYTGLGYLGYLTAIFALLCDVVFNRARVVTRIINAFLQSIGSASSVVPC